MTDAPQDHDAAIRLLPVVLRVFFRIAERWQLTDVETARVLGVPTSRLPAAKAGEIAGLDEDTLFRIGNVLTIYKAIQTLLPVPDRADGWIKAVNRAQIFGGKRAIDLIADGSIQSIVVVRRYLESQLFT